ncbi:uncharacterized protein LOC127865482 [Dreissena polymorpha]|uniref:uncharacterized protein LOC127865482 n=1 Tax=Dreissena polymorpha TaxID=45954 RepID=UPI002264012E|nr:uncharacterized protein LOC127865482 [Dreissena polymorpha]
MWRRLLLVSVLCIIASNQSEGKEKLFCGPRHVRYPSRSTSDQCPNNTCCVSFLQQNGTEQPWARKVPVRFKTDFAGKCIPYSQIGAGCNQYPVFADDYARIYFGQCQCAKTLYCEDQNVQAPEGYVGVCSPRPTKCQNVSMCKSDECCVSDYGIVGQKEGPGTCQTMRKLGDRCLIQNGSGRPEDMVTYSCPCMENHECGGIDVIPARFGSIGRCVAVTEST